MKGTEIVFEEFKGKKKEEALIRKFIWTIRREYGETKLSQKPGYINYNNKHDLNIEMKYFKIRITRLGLLRYLVENPALIEEAIQRRQDRGLIDD